MSRILLRHNAQTRVRDFIATRAVRGLQIRCRIESAVWQATLMLVGDQFRLVRIRHDFGGAIPDSR